MMNNLTFRNLRADELDARVCYKKRTRNDLFFANILVYKNARVDMQVLDETVGALNWQRDHKEAKGNLYCGIGIKDDKGEFIWKWDCGKESNLESEKGEASDSFKRAGFNWGIGRALYTCPEITLFFKNENEYEQECRGLKVSKIEYKDDKVSELQLSNNKGKILFSWKSGDKKFEQAEPMEKEPATKEMKATASQLELLRKIYKNLDREKQAELKQLINDNLTLREASELIRKYGAMAKTKEE